jgi:signal recognition particle receptor subunit beta
LRKFKAKILIVGEPNAGKSFIAQTTEACLPFKEIGVSIGRTNLRFKDTECELTLITWTVTKGRPKETTYFNDTAAAIIVSDLKRPETVRLSAEWAQNILDRVGDIPLFFATNNADLGQPNTLDYLEDIAERYNSSVYQVKSNDRESAKEIFITIADVLSENMGLEKVCTKDDGILK